MLKGTRLKVYSHVLTICTNVLTILYGSLGHFESLLLSLDTVKSCLRNEVEICFDPKDKEYMLK